MREKAVSVEKGHSRGTARHRKGMGAARELREGSLVTVTRTRSEARVQHALAWLVWASAHSNRDGGRPGPVLRARSVT